MTDLVITPASVLAGSVPFLKSGRAGEAIAPGQTVYRTSRSAPVMLADNNSPIAQARRADGIALNQAAPGQPVMFLTAGHLRLGAALSPGMPYFLSGNPGKICPAADIAIDDFVCLLGFAISTTTLLVKIQSPGVSYGTGGGAAYWGDSPAPDGYHWEFVAEDVSGQRVNEDATGQPVVALVGN